ncbi:MAG: GvpL/GvpF family gas vesicle protein [Pseudonocardiaceae bacterium]
MTEPGSYVYGVVRGLDPAVVAGLAGVAGNPVRVVVHGALSALVSPVDLAEFDESGLRRNFEDISWLEATAREHHAVLAAAALDAPVVPLRLATIYRSTDGVRALLAERGAIFDAALRRVQGRTEWGLKAYLDPGQRSAPSVEQPAADSPGTAYLHRRRAQLRSSEELRQAAEHGAEVIHRAVSAAAEAVRRYPPQDRKLSGHSSEMVLNAAYLLSGTDRAPLEEALHQAGSWPLQVEWTGPWVPYSFVELEPDP